MGVVRVPRSLRARGSGNSRISGNCGHDWVKMGGKGTVAIAALAAVGPVGTAEAQSSLPPVTVDAPVTRAKPAAPQLTAEQRRVRAAVRRAAKQKQQQQAAPSAGAGAESAQAPDRNPYANPDSPYKADRL